MNYREQFLKDLREPRQLELFVDDETAWARRSLIALMENQDKFDRLAKVFDRVLGPDWRNKEIPE